MVYVFKQDWIGFVLFHLFKLLKLTTTHFQSQLQLVIYVLTSDPEISQNLYIKMNKTSWTYSTIHYLSLVLIRLSSQMQSLPLSFFFVLSGVSDLTPSNPPTSLTPSNRLFCRLASLDTDPFPTQTLLLLMVMMVMMVMVLHMRRMMLMLCLHIIRYIPDQYYTLFFLIVFNCIQLLDIKI